MMEKTKTILFIGNFLSDSVGTRGISEDLRIRLQERGWEVLYASTRMNKVLRLVDMVKTVYRSRDEYQVANVDVFSGPSFFWAEIVTWLLLALHKTVSLTLRGGGLPDFARRCPARVRRLLASAACVNTPSNYLQIAFSPIRADIKWLPNGIDLARYTTRERNFKSPRLVWLRAFHQIYNPQMAVKVLSILRSHNIDCSLTMVGPDKRDGTYESVIEQAKLEQVLKYIHITGQVEKSHVPVCLDQGDIFLNTTRLESFGVSVVEAAACGLPIVSTNVGELSYLWKNEFDALLVPPDDPVAMAAAVDRILTEPDLAYRLTQNGRRKAERFDWLIVLPQWEKLLLNLIKDA